MVKKRELTVGTIVIYCVIFYFIWSLRELVVRPVFLDSLTGLPFQIVESSMKLLVWTMPALLLIRHFKEDMWIGLSEMLETKPKWFKSAPILLLVLTPLLISGISGGLAISPELKPVTLIESVLFAGITEEVVFRGFLLNSTIKKMKLPYAIVLNAVLFWLIHFPYWIYLKHDLLTFLGGGITVMAVSALFSFSFVKTKNIFTPIILHMIYNLCVILFR